MILYIGISFFYIICMFIEKVRGKRLNRKIWTLVLIIPLFIIAAFRSPNIGNDTLNYYRSYLIVSQEKFFSRTRSRFEPGYVFFMKIIDLLGFDYLGFQIITSAIIMFSVGRFISKYSNNIAFSFYIFVTTRMFFGTMNIVRQYLAIAILLFSVEYIKKRNFIKFSILVLIAYCFHSTAIVFLIMYPIANIKFDAKKTVVFLGIGMVSSIFFDFLVRKFVILMGKYEGYLYGEYFNFEHNIAIYFHLLINCCFFLVAVIGKYWDANNSKNINQHENYKIKTSNNSLIKIIPNEQLWYTCCIFTLLFSIIGLKSTIINRIELYFSVFFLAFIPSLTRSIKSKEIRAIVIGGIIIGLFISFIIVMIYRPRWNIVFPYEWYWDWN